MRAVALLLCLGLAACAGKIPGEPAEPLAFAPSAQAVPSQAAAPPPNVRTAASGGAHGGAGTASARTPAPAAEDNPDAPTPTGDPLTQARADCWMKTEKLKLRDIDARAAFVDKCVTEVMKTGRKP